MNEAVRSPSKDHAQDRMQRATAGAIGALAGTTIAGPPGAVVGAVASVALEPVVARVWSEVSADGRRRAAETLAHASDAARMSPEQFADRIDASEQSKLLAGIALSAATRTAYAPKIRALGRALANGLADDCARIDEEQLIMGALADMEAPHVSLLELLVAKQPEWGGAIDTWKATKSEGRDQFGREPRRWTQRQMTSARPSLAPVLPGLLGTLQRHGLAVVESDLAEALEKYGKEVEREAKSQSSRLTRSSTTRAIRVPKAISAFRLRNLVPDGHWSPTEFGEAVFAYLVGVNAPATDD